MDSFRANGMICHFLLLDFYFFLFFALYFSFLTKQRTTKIKNQRKIVDILRKNSEKILSINRK